MIKFYYHDLNEDPVLYVYDEECEQYFSTQTDGWYVMYKDWFDTKVANGEYVIVKENS